MKFDNYLKGLMNNPSRPSNQISLYPVSDYNLEGVRILFENCMRMGSGQPSNVSIATIDPSLWLGQILEKHWGKISFVSSSVNFEVLKFEGDELISKFYKSDIISFNAEEELDKFFEDRKWKKLVIFSIIKIADLTTMKTSFSIRYSDITEKYEERDGKLNSILDTNI